MADVAGVDYVLSLTPDTIDLLEDLRATPVLITHDPDDLEGLDRLAARDGGTGPRLTCWTRSSPRSIRASPRRWRATSRSAGATPEPSC